MHASRGLRLLALLGLALLASPRAGSDQAPPRGDDHYAFAASAGQERAVTLSAAGAGFRLAFPAPAGWDTALLGVRVNATGPQPRVELRAGPLSSVQYLDAEARGLRFLNLTGLRAQLTEGAMLELTGQDLSLEPAASLRSFSNRLDLKRRVLILAPHPDDAEIAAFGLYSSSSNVTIVTVTSGNAGDANYQDHFGSDAASQYLFKGYLRAVDSVTVPWQGGVPPERCYNLGYFDARLRSMQQKPHDTFPELYGPNDDVAPYRRANVSRLLPTGARKNSWDNLVADLVSVFRKVDPEIVVTAHPFLDSHADHQYVTVAAAEALLRWKKPATFLLYTNHASQNLYPFGPAGTAVSLPPWAGPQALSVEGVYSHPLSDELQRRKLFALESMHDLRLAPIEQSTCSDPAAPRRPDYPRVPAVDYFRRGPRPDEVFFVFSRTGLAELVRSFLKSEVR